MNLVALIPARSGSKGISNKNIRNFKGKPLLSWTIEQALAIRAINQVIVSTDDASIAKIAEQFGAEVPFLRPKNLATDSSPVLDSILNLLERMPSISDVLLLQPTSPLRRIKDIENIIKLREDNKRESAVSVSKVSQYPQWMYRIKNGFMFNFAKEGNLLNRRQDLEEFFILNGALYLSSKKHLLENKSFISEETIPYVMPEENSLDIDEEIDWKYGEFLFDQLN